MKVKFNKSLVTVHAKFVKGRSYDLSEKLAKQFIKEGHAEEVKPPVKRKRKPTKKVD